MSLQSAAAVPPAPLPLFGPPVAFDPVFDMPSESSTDSDEEVASVRANDDDDSESEQLPPAVPTRRPGFAFPCAAFSPRPRAPVPSATPPVVPPVVPLATEPAPPPPVPPPARAVPAGPPVSVPRRQHMVALVKTLDTGLSWAARKQTVMRIIAYADLLRYESSRARWLHIAHTDILRYSTHPWEQYPLDVRLRFSRSSYIELYGALPETAEPPEPTPPPPPTKRGRPAGSRDRPRGEGAPKRGRPR